MEALRLTNKHLLRELEQLAKQIPRRRDRPEKAETLLPKKNSNTSTLLEKQMEKEKLAKSGSMTLTNPLERIAMRRGMVRTTEAMDPSFISRRQGSGHGNSVQRHPARAQPHERNCKRTSSSLHGRFGVANRIPTHGRGAALPVTF